MGSNVTGATAKREMKRVEVQNTEALSLLDQHSNLGLVIVLALEPLNQI
jgi:hypothetical protein